MSGSTKGAAVWLLALALGGAGIAQEPSPPTGIKSSACNRERALTIIEDQIDLTRTFDDDRRRITVLVRAADLLWPYNEKRARAAFTDALEIAERHFKQNGDAPERDGKLLISTPDQRYVVIGSIARHDAAWAKKLSEAVLKQQEETARDQPAKDEQRDIQTAERLLMLARSLLAVDEPQSMNFARASFRFPATMYLAGFLYELAAQNRADADRLYEEALTAYSNAPMERLLYLSAYPFGMNRDAGDTPGYTVYNVPAGFALNVRLQRLLVQTILRRVQDFINDPSTASKGARTPDLDEMWLVLTRLEKQIQQSLPDLAPAVSTARSNLSARLTQNSQRALERRIAGDSPPVRSFAEQVEAALKNPSVDERDRLLTTAIIYSSQDETVDRVLEVVDKISDSDVRQPLLNWFYFDRAQRAIKEQRPDEARKFAAKVAELDQRAFLYARIAEGALKESPDQIQARQVLEEAVESSEKAPPTAVKARALLTLAFLYTKIDVSRAIAIVGDAVNCINRIENADFSRQFVIRKIEGRSFGTYASVATPGFTPENAFREVGKADFDGMLSQASNLSDKSLRAMCILALVEQCLKVEQLPSPSNRLKSTPGNR